MKNILRNWIIAILHLVIIIFICITPWIISWEYIIIIFILYRLQLIILKGCILSQLQFGNKDEGFYYHYIKKFYPKIKTSTIDLVVDTVMPIIIIITAYIIQ